MGSNDFEGFTSSAGFVPESRWNLVWSCGSFFNLPVSQRRELHTAGCLVPYDKYTAPSQCSCGFITIKCKWHIHEAMDFYTSNNLVTCWKHWAKDCSAEKQENSCEPQKHQLQCVCAGLSCCTCPRWVVCRGSARLQQHQQPMPIQQLQSSQDMPGLCWSKGARGERPETPPKGQLGALISTSKTVPAGALRQNGASTTNVCVADLGQEGTEQD